MAKLTIGQKAERVITFLVALRNRRIAAHLAQHGFSQKDLNEGWSLLRDITRTSLDVPLDQSDADPDALRALDAWENKWFAIAAATLKRNAPQSHDWLFRNLSQTEGVAVIVSVGTFVDRLDLLDKPQSEGGLGASGEEAKKILAARGLTKTIIEEAKALLDKLQKVDGPLPDIEKDDAETASFDKAEDALWDWYLEWSAIARQAIQKRSYLKQLGFLRTTPSGKDEEVQDEDAPEVNAKSKGETR